MSQQPQKTPKSTSTEPSKIPQQWSLRRRWIVSILLLLHLIAIFAAPMASPPPASDLSRQIAGWFEPYLFAAFLNHGYRFFAPNPGPSHLVRYEIDLPDGKTITGHFPDVDQHRPRLYYHRYLMISETVFNVSNIPDSDPFVLGQRVKQLRAAAQRLQGLGFEEEAQGYLEEAENIQALLDGQIDPQQRRSMEESLQRKEALLTGIANDLLSRHQGIRVRLYIQTHDIANPADVLAGQPINDPSLYSEILLGEFTGDMQ